MLIGFKTKKANPRTPCADENSRSPVRSRPVCERLNSRSRRFDPENSSRDSKRNRGGHPGVTAVRATAAAAACFQTRSLAGAPGRDYPHALALRGSRAPPLAARVDDDLARARLRGAPAPRAPARALAGSGRAPAAIADDADAPATALARARGGPSSAARLVDLGRRRRRRRPRRSLLCCAPPARLARVAAARAADARGGDPRPRARLLLTALETGTVAFFERCSRSVVNVGT